MGVLKLLLYAKESIEARKMWLARLCAIIVMTSSCAYSTHDISVKKGIPIDQSAINQIVIGKTTRSDVFKLLGTPHSIFHGQVEVGFVEGEAVPYYSYIENRPLSSIDDKHYALLYRFGKLSAKSTSKTITIVHYRNTQVSIKSNELLLFINKETDIVDDVAYRKETSEP